MKRLSMYLKRVMHGEGGGHRADLDELLERVGRRSGVVDHDRRVFSLVLRQLRVQTPDLKRKDGRQQWSCLISVPDAGNWLLSPHSYSSKTAAN